MMERDFLGLSSREPAAVVKEERKGGWGDEASMGGLGMQWTFSNKISAFPPSMTMNVFQEEQPKKLTFEHHSSSGFQPITAAFDCSQKSVYSPTQRMFSLETQGPNSVPTCQTHSIDTHMVSSQWPHEIRSLQASNLSFSAAMPSPFFNIHGTSSGLNMAAESAKQPPLGGTMMANPHSIVPGTGGMAGTYAPRNISKSEGAPQQLTIFYKGMVNVFDNISPEKAQAIMFLAGSRSSMASISSHPKAALMQAVAPKHTVADGIHGSQSRVASPCSGLSSPISVGSHPSGQPGGRSSNTDNLMVTNTSALLVDSSNQSEPPKVEKLVASAATTLVPSAVPQARKASLARFLEKRKERVVNSGPYSHPTSSTENACGSNVSSPVSKPQTTPVAQSSSNDQQFCRALHKNDPMNLQAKSEM